MSKKLDLGTYDVVELDLKCELKYEHEEINNAEDKEIIVLSSDDSDVDDENVTERRWDSCDFTSSDTSELSNHVKLVHSGFTSWSCVCHATEKGLCSCQHRNELQSVEPGILDNLKNDNSEALESGLDYIRKTAVHCELVADNPGAKGQQYCCHLCDYNSFSRLYVNLHLKKTHSRNKLYYCHRCNYLTKKKKELLVHIKKEFHLKKRPLKCQLCDFKSWLQFDLKRHVITCHKPSSNAFETSFKTITCDNRITFKCPYCDFTYSDQRDIKWHKELKHRTLDLCNCLICDYSGSTQTDLMRHIEISHKCKCCSFVSMTASGLNSHLTEKHGFKNLNSVKSPNGSENRWSELVNDNSNFPRSSNDALNYVSLNGAVNCFSSNEERRGPYRSHFSSGSKGSLSHNRLKDYLRLYASTLRRGTKRFSCDKCDFRTSLRNQFVFHRKLFHSKIINSVYHCRLCSYKNKNKKRLSLHVKKIHSSRKFYNCHVCAFKARLKDTLESHFESVHKAVDDTTDSGLVEYVYISESSMNDSDPVQTKYVNVTSNVAKTPKAKSTRLKKSDGMNVINNRPNYNCSLCKVQLKSSSDLVAHVYTSHLFQKCCRCEFSCFTETDLSKHLTTVHGCENPSQEIAVINSMNKDDIVDPDCQIIEQEGISEHSSKNQNPAKCYMCGKLLRLWIEHTSEGYKINGGACQNASDRFLCSFCYTCVTQVPSQYLVASQPQPEAVPVIEFYTCDICGYKSPSGTGLNDHIRQAHSNLIFFKCQFCTFRIVGKDLLDKHMNETHKDKIATERIGSSQVYNTSVTPSLLNSQPLPANMVVLLSVPSPSQQAQESIDNSLPSSTNHLVSNEFTYESSSLSGHNNSGFESSDFYVEVSEQDNAKPSPENVVITNSLDEVYGDEIKSFHEDNKKKQSSENESLFTDMEDVSWEEIKLLSEKNKSRPLFENYDMIRAMDIVSVEVIEPVSNESKSMPTFGNDDLIISIDEICGKDMKPREVESILPDVDPVCRNDGLILSKNTLPRPDNEGEVEAILPDVGPDCESNSFLKNVFSTQDNRDMLMEDQNIIKKHSKYAANCFMDQVQCDNFSDVDSNSPAYQSGKLNQYFCLSCDYKSAELIDLENHKNSHHNLDSEKSLPILYSNQTYSVSHE